MTRRQYQEFQKAQTEEIHRVKMYKAKKQWITAGITAFSMAVGLTAFTTTTAHAATSWTARSSEAIQASLKSEGTTPYKIVWGDTLSTIADAANRNGIETSVARLAEINKISNIDLIFAGNTLWFNGSGSNGTVSVTDKNGNTHTFNLDPNKSIQANGNNGNGTSTNGGAQSNVNNGSTTTNNGSGSSSNNNNSGNTNSGSNNSNDSNVNNGSGNNSNSNNGSNNNNNSNNNGSDGNSNNNGGTTDPTAPVNPNKDEVAYKINFIDYANNDKVFKTIELKGKIGEKVNYTADVSVDVDGVYYILGSSAELQHSITLDKDSNKNVINVKYFPQVLPDKTSYIVNYVDEAGKPVAKSKKIDNVKMMSDIIEYAPQVDGYTVKNSNVISTILTEENQVLTFVYEKATTPTTKADINIHFVDEDGKEIAPTKKSQGNVGDIFTASALSIDGYKLNGEATQSIKLSKSGNDITFHYTKAVAPVEKTSYTVSYQTADGTKLEADKVVNDQEVGKSITETAHTIKGYKLTSQATQAMTLAKSGNHITFTYAKEEAPVAKTTYTVSYQAEDGTKLQADKTVKDQTVGASVSETAPAISGYTIKGNATQTMTLAKDNNHISFVYTKNVAPIEGTYVRINQVDTAGKVVDTKIVKDLRAGDKYTATVVPIEHYSIKDFTGNASDWEKTVTLVNGENNVNFVMRKQGHVTLRALDENGNVLDTNTYWTTQDHEGIKNDPMWEGDHYDTSGLYVDGYVKDDVPSKSIILHRDGDTIDFKYKKSDGGEVAKPDAQAISAKFTELANQERQRVGVAPLKVQPSIVQAAQVRAKQLEDDFSHDSDGLSKLAVQYGYEWGNCSENIAQNIAGIGETSDEIAQELYNQIKNSQGHYVAMIAPDAVDTGVGIYISENNLVYMDEAFGYGQPVETSSVTSKYMDETGREIASQEVQVGNVGDKFTITAKKIAGYTLVGSETQTGTYSKEGSVITFNYKSDTPVNVDHSTPVNAPAGTPGLLDGDSIPAGNAHNIWFYSDKEAGSLPEGQTASNLFFATMQDATNFAEKYLDDTMLEPNPLFNGYAVTGIYGDDVTNGPIAYTIEWR